MYIFQYFSIIISAQIIMNAMFFCAAIFYFLLKGHSPLNSIQHISVFIITYWKLIPAILIPVLLIQIGRTGYFIRNIRQHSEKRLSECWLYFAYMTLGVVIGCIIDSLLFFYSYSHFFALIVLSLLVTSTVGLLASLISAPVLNMLSFIFIPGAKDSSR